MEIKIINMTRKLPEGIVESIEHCFVLIDGDYQEVSFPETVYLDAIQPDDEQFIPFAQVTQEVAKQWVLDALSDDQLEARRRTLQNFINRRKTPVVADGLPWGGN